MRIEYSMDDVADLLAKDLASKGFEGKASAEWRIQVRNQSEVKVVIAVKIDEPKADDA